HKPTPAMDTNGNHDSNAGNPAPSSNAASRLSNKVFGAIAAPFSFYFGSSHHAYLSPGAALLISYEEGQPKRARLRSSRLFFPPRTKCRKVSDAQIQALARSYGEDPSPIFRTQPVVLAVNAESKTKPKRERKKVSPRQRISAAELGVRKVLNTCRQQLLVRWWALGEILRNIGARTRNVLVRIPVPYLSNRRG
ncbi:MAG: hypothetical protein AAF585_29190, partial [Verrucomicrobiota bacterium]